MPEYKNTAGKKKSKKANKAGNTIRLGFFWIIVLAIGGLLFFNLTNSGDGLEVEKSLTEVLAYANEEKLESITVRGNELHVTPRPETDLPKMVSRKEGSGTLQEQGFEEAIAEGKVSITVEEVKDIWGSIFDIAIIVLPTLFVVLFLGHMMRQAQSMNNQSMGFGKAKARVYGNEKKRVLFEDVAGNEAAKQDLSEIVDFLKNPKKYERVGAKIPRGVLLAGEPCTGKTLMARSVAGGANFPVF
jgi:cell division protease FtsH